MQKIGRFELPNPENVTSACDICKAFSGADETSTRDGLFGKTKDKLPKCGVYQANHCIDATRSQILLAYFQLIQGFKQ